MTPMTKQQLFFEIEHLPNVYIAELQNFIQYLKFKQSSAGGRLAKDRGRPPEYDPLLPAIGVIDEAPFAETIDETVYAM